MNRHPKKSSKPMTEFSQKNKTSTSIDIEKIKIEKDITFLEAMLIWAEERNIDIEDIPLYISDVIIEKLRTEQVELNAIKSEKAPSTGSLDQWL